MHRDPEQKALQDRPRRPRVTTRQKGLLLLDRSRLPEPFDRKSNSLSGARFQVYFLQKWSTKESTYE